MTLAMTQVDDVERKQFPRYQSDLAPAKPFLMPSFNDEIVEILPSEKPNRKIRFDEKVLVQEIENRYAYIMPDADDDSYEIEIVEDDGDADFYLEIVDGEVFYVFETEDDISVDDDDYEEMEESETEEGYVSHVSSRGALQLPIDAMMAPNLSGDESSQEDSKDKSFATFEDALLPSMMSEEEKEHILEVHDSEDEQDGASVESSVLSLDGVASTKQKPTEQPRPVSPVISEQEQIFEDVSSPTQNRPESVAIKCSSPQSPPQEAMFIVDRVPMTPIQGPIAPASPGVSPASKSVRSILKACPESPKKATPKKPKNKKKGEKTYTKTYIRADHYDGEHRVYNWEKPDWTKKQLRSTGMGDTVRQGGNLANPITFPKKKPVNPGIQEEEAQVEIVETMDKNEIIRRLREGGHRIPGYQGNQRKLKFSVAGTHIRTGGDIVKPITKATVLRKPEDINHVANQKILKPTSVGDQVRQGESLAAPVTKATVERKYEFEKPEWAKKGPALKPTGKRLESPTGKKKMYQWEKPSWTKQRLGTTGLGDKVKEGETLANPITFPVGQGDGINKEVQPEGLLRRTSKGELVRQGETLALPITQLPHLPREEQ